MHDILKPYIMEGLSYIGRDKLVDILKEKDSTYFIDDLNYLTISMESLCGYIPGTDYSRNFSYVRAFDAVTDEEGNIMRDRRVNTGIIISCRDLDVLEKYLDFHYEHRLHKLFSLNVPVRFPLTGQDGVEAVRELLKKYDGYYRFTNKPPIHDYRFPDPENVPAPELNEIYDVKNEFVENNIIYGDTYYIKKLSWTLYKHGTPVFEELINSCCEDIGLKCISFGWDINNLCDDREIEADDVLYFRRYIASKFAKDGYTVKNIAVNRGFDNEEMYERMGMTRYRSFITLKTEDYVKGENCLI